MHFLLMICRKFGAFQNFLMVSVQMTASPNAQQKKSIAMCQISQGSHGKEVMQPDWVRI